jgi:hypothetical protein
MSYFVSNKAHLIDKFLFYCKINLIKDVKNFIKMNLINFKIKQMVYHQEDGYYVVILI